MDKPRSFVTWVIACVACNLTYHDDFTWTLIKCFPLAFAAVLIERIRSNYQNRSGE